ncbi:MAG: hypothetical protein DI539_25385 [Flavobacterium psychrophilum]|nr:MAG: hypothetical protein DI539_25385 [Flavobacterium psychrophilum]
MSDEIIKKKNRPGQGRKYKMTDKLVSIFENIVRNQPVAFLTDEELVFLINKELETKERIDIKTFKNWKSGKSPDNETARKFEELYVDARMIQKLGLLSKILEGGDKNWYRFAWILKNKWDNEYNPATQIQHTSEKTINILPANDEQKKLIDNIFNVINDAEYVEVPPKQIATKKKKKKDDEYEF